MKNKSKKILKIDNNTFFKRDRTMKYFSNISNNKKDLDEKIKEIIEEEMNKECFDCGALNPKFISLNNGIFLCQDCIQLHNKFSRSISLIMNNNLFLLTNKEILYIYYGGNNRLNNFVNYEYPGLQNYQPNILYHTQAMDYYRNRLKALVEKKNLPEKPNSIYAYKLIGENVNKYSQNRLLFEISQENNNEINIPQYSSKKFRKIENGKNLKYIYKDLRTQNENKRKFPPLYLESFSSNNSLKNILLNSNKEEKQNNKNLRKYIENNDINRDESIYNKTFFKDMKNLFNHENLKGKLRMRINEKENTKDYIKDELLTHQESLSNTLYFPNINNPNVHKKNVKSFRKMENPKFMSLKNLEKDKYITINNNFSHIYIKPRMSNNSFSKNYKNIKNCENGNINYKKKKNSIINGMTKFSLKKLNLKENSSLNIKENGFKPKNQYFYSKSNTTKNIFSGMEQKKIEKEKRSPLNLKICNYIYKPNEKQLSKRELSFNRNNNLILNENFQSIQNSKENSIEQNKISPIKRGIFNTKYNSNISRNIEESKTINNHIKKDNNKGNFIKVVKTNIRRRNNSDLNWNKIEYFNKSSNIIHNANNKIKILEDNGKKNNKFLNDDIENNRDKRYLKAKQDQQEQELIEKEDLKKLLLDENSLFNKDIDIKIINKSSNNDINGGLNNLKESNKNFNYFCNPINSHNNINNKYEIIKNETVFFNKNNCTDLINLSKENNIKNIYNNNISISEEFLIEAKNIIKFFQTNMNIKQYRESDKIKILNKIKTDKENNSNLIDKSNISIRNKYKQKALLIHENNTNFVSNEKQDIYKNIIQYYRITNNITEDNWNINQLGEIKIYEVIKNIESD